MPEKMLNGGGTKGTCSKEASDADEDEHTVH